MSSKSSELVPQVKDCVKYQHFSKQIKMSIGKDLLRQNEGNGVVAHGRACLAHGRPWLPFSAPQKNEKIDKGIVSIYI